MVDSLRPTTEAALADAVAAASAEQVPLEVVAGGSKRGFGRPVQAARTLHIDGMTGITLYEPSELVISARAGTPVAEVERTLAAHGQRLPFEPADYRALLETDKATPTIGGAVACNLSGPARIAAGALRDHLIGVRFVNGRGEVLRAGGRVMKNVTGYDLCKLLAGSFGTLGVLSEVTFKVLPQPESTATLVLRGLPDVAAMAAMARALGSPFDVTAAAHLPAWAASASGGATQSDRSATAMRLEGFEASVAYRSAELAALLVDFGTADTLDDEAGRAFWPAIRDVAPIARGTAGDADRAVWRISTKPTEGAALLRQIADRLPVRGFYDWGGGLVWMVVDDPQAEECGAGPIREAVATIGGHATLVRGSPAQRAAIPVFQPVAGPLAVVAARLKASFDPNRILNPGRMYSAV